MQNFLRVFMDVGPYFGTSLMLEKPKLKRIVLWCKELNTLYFGFAAQNYGEKFATTLYLFYHFLRPL